MRLEVTRSGGFAGMTRQWSTDVPDAECSPLITALRQADGSGPNRPDERLYRIRLGDISASVPEHRTRQGALAVLIEWAQHGGRSQP